ncbi:MAG TPA: hypothetical protein VH298_01955 [Jatrophihabitans sp.]|jgi:hypothetical protein|nr:hypothetical protein [Jatrophihabitans sp.]
MGTAQYGAVLLVLAVCLVVIVRFELLCFRDLAGRHDHELNYLTRAGWTVLIAVLIPIGGICYLYLGRPN